MSGEKNRDYYSILEVNQQAGQDEIKKAYRKKALQYHPDRNPDSPQAEEKFKEATEAYSILSDPEKRAVYDQYGFEGLQRQGGGASYSDFSSVFNDFGDIFGSFFGDAFGFGQTRRSRSRKGDDLWVEVSLTLEEAAQGVEREISLHRKESCDLCGGSGVEKGHSKERCPSCGGSGEMRTSQGFFTFSRTCPHCSGQGEINRHPCRGCQGKGYAYKDKSLKVKIPPGVDEGMKVRLEREGEPGTGGAPRGDLYVGIKVKAHKRFQRQESDLFLEMEISPSQAALGTRIGVPTLLGDPVDLSVPAGTQGGALFKIKGQGMPHLRRDGRGLLLVKVKVKTPSDLTEEEKNLYQKLAELRGEAVGNSDKDGLFSKVKSIFN